MLKKIQPKELQENVFEMIGKQWMLICAESKEKVNAMTASWGGMGVIWNKDVATVYLRPQRYTKEFVDHSDTFSLMLFPENYRKQLTYMGSVSGREEDKIAHCDFHIDHIDETPYFKEATIIITCRKLYAQQLQPECFIDQALDTNNYPKKDYHEMYIGEILGVYKKADN